jgi:hypothetical protein
LFITRALLIFAAYVVGVNTGPKSGKRIAGVKTFPDSSHRDRRVTAADQYSISLKGETELAVLTG